MVLLNGRPGDSEQKNEQLHQGRMPAKKDTALAPNPELVLFYFADDKEGLIRTSYINHSNARYVTGLAAPIAREAPLYACKRFIERLYTWKRPLRQLSVPAKRKNSHYEI